MNILKRYAKTTTKEPTEVLSLRIPRSVYNNFKKHCERYGLSMSEATAILIKSELGDDHRAPTHEDVVNSLQKEVTKKSPTPQNVAPKKIPRNQTGRFITAKYQVGNDLPCPICNDWLSQSNFSRHAKQKHNKTTQELLTDSPEKVMLMVKTKTSSPLS